GSISVSVDDGSPPYQYFWTDEAGNSIPGTTNLDNLPNGEYTLLVTDLVECEDEVTFTIESDPLPEITLETEAGVCDQPNGAINLSGFPGISTILLNGIPTSLNDLQSIIPGNYEAIVENQNGCLITDTLITVDNVTPFDFSGDSTLFVEAGELTQFVIPGVNEQDFSFEWLPRMGLTCYDCPDPRVETNEDLVYQVIVEDLISGCDGQFQLFVEVLPPQDLYIPNVFSPNFDGINDQFQAFPSDADLEILQVAVFDRWGTLLFQGSGEDAAWDGTFRGQAAGTGTYSYFVEIQYRTGRREVLTGDLLLLR
ncbi:MAG: gliding motility-associated C-terminal domain-containing protein, partial [Bacteroidota bacterium]